LSIQTAALTRMAIAISVRPAKLKKDTAEYSSTAKKAFKLKAFKVLHTTKVLHLSR
jgi:hypothetical protein